MSQRVVRPSLRRLSQVPSQHPGCTRPVPGRLVGWRGVWQFGLPHDAGCGAWCHLFVFVFLVSLVYFVLCGFYLFRLEGGGNS